MSPLKPLSRLFRGLSRTRENLQETLKSVFTSTRLDEDAIEDLEVRENAARSTQGSGVARQVRGMRGPEEPDGLPVLRVGGRLLQDEPVGWLRGLHRISRNHRAIRGLDEVRA